MIPPLQICRYALIFGNISYILRTYFVRLRAFASHIWCVFVLPPTAVLVFWTPLIRTPLG